MKIRYILSAALLSALSLSSCSDDEQPLTGGSEVEINATIGSGTRTEPYQSDDRSATFNDGDVIRVEAESQTAQFVYSGGTWSLHSGKRMMWNLPSMHFRATYPSTASGDTFTLPADQSTREALSSADYMTYSGIHSKKDGTVTLEMERQTARIVVVPRLSEDLKSAGAVIKGVTINADNTVDSNKDRTSIKSLSLGEEYIILASPGPENQSVGIVVTLQYPNGSVSTLGEIVNEMLLVKGTSYKVTLNINGSTVKVDDIGITPWTDGTIPGGTDIYKKNNNKIGLQNPGILTAEMITETLEGGDSLCLEGPMNGSDFRVLREYMGCKYNIYEENTPSPIHYLDMRGVRMVKGEESYAYSHTDLMMTEDDVSPPHAFYNLKSDVPVEILLPAGVTKIGERAFNRSYLGRVVAPENLVSIEKQAFFDLTVSEIILPKTLRYLGINAISNCNNLKRLEIPEGTLSMVNAIARNTCMEYLYLPYSINEITSGLEIEISNMKTLKLMIKPEFADTQKNLCFLRNNNLIPGKFIDCDLYLCNERKGEVTDGNTWADKTWKSITFVDGATLK